MLPSNSKNCWSSYAPYTHQKSTNWVLNMVRFDALALMLLTKVVPNRTLRRCCSGTIFLGYDAKFEQNKCKFISNSTKITALSEPLQNICAIKGQVLKYAPLFCWVRNQNLLWLLSITSSYILDLVW